MPSRGGAGRGIVRGGMTGSAPPASLKSLVFEKRIIICVGSGGVGKTTTAATLALTAALSGKRVLALTIDPARRLADALGLKALGHDIQQVPDEKLDEVARRRGQSRAAGGQLYAMMLDQKRAFDELVERYAKDPALRQRILKNAIYRQISASLAGSHEYAAMSKLHTLTREGDWDLLVLDTPPTANALDFLDAPERLSEAVDSPALQWFVKPYLKEAGSFSLRLFGVGGAFVLRGISRFVGSQFLQQMAEFFVEFGEVTAGFRERAREVKALLRRPEVAFVLVCSPEPLSIEEALFFYGRLSKAAMPLGGIVVNRVNAAGPELGPDFETLIAQRLAARPEMAGFLPDDLARLAADLARTYGEQQTIAAADAAAIELLQQKTFGSPQKPGDKPGDKSADKSQEIKPAGANEKAPPILRVPMFEHDIHDAAGIALVSEYLAP
jgi:anion-transporting  ArsA/GET3 family ATPase